jgi:hypothetical protein
MTQIALTNAFRSVKGCKIHMEYVLNVLEKSINNVRIKHLNLASILIVAEWIHNTICQLK